MKAESGKTQSLWAASADVPQFEPLKNDIYAEVCVIGGGIAGLTTAYLAAREGMSVVVLDDNDIAGGETQRTTAHLSNVLDDRYYNIEHIRGVRTAKLAYRSHSEAINRIEKIAIAENIDCDFMRVDGYLFCAPEQSRQDLHKELQALKNIGYRGVEWLESTPLGFGSNNMPCLRFPRQAQFRVLKYISGLARAIVNMNGRIFTYTHVSEVKDGRPAVVHTASGAKVRSAWVVCATNSPITDYAKVHLKEAAYRTYAGAARVPVGYVTRALFWDMADPYHYIRTQPIQGSADEWLIVGGEDHRTGQDKPQEHFDKLAAYIHEMFPAVKEIEHLWSGQVLEPADGLALIGRDPERGENILIATGDSGMGMTHGTIAGIMLTDTIMGRENPWEAVYEPKRWPLRATTELVAENTSSAASYLRYLDAITADSIEHIRPGQAAIIQKAGKKLAIYRDANGHLTVLSAVCPHMKSIVCWNDCEQSWDCPAHGSRFTATGEVIDGPAISNMEHVDYDKLIAESGEHLPQGPDQPSLGA